MMCFPSIDSLVKKVDSKYTLVTLAADRARELTDGQPPLIPDAQNKSPWHWKKFTETRLPTALINNKNTDKASIRPYRYFHFCIPQNFEETGFPGRICKCLRINIL